MRIDLLATEKLKYRRDATPLFMTFPVNPDGAPFLVSSPSGFVWVPEAMNGAVHTAVREIRQPVELNLEIVGLIAERGVDQDWGNVHPLTTEGVEGALEYVRYFGIEQVDLLVPSQKKVIDLVPDAPDVRAILEVEWLEDMVLAVPSDRSFFGTLGLLSPKKAIVLVHNPSRGLGIARA